MKKLLLASLIAPMFLFNLEARALEHKARLSFLCSITLKCTNGSSGIGCTLNPQLSEKRLNINDSTFDIAKKGLSLEIVNQTVILKDSKSGPGIIVGKVNLNGLKCPSIREGGSGTVWRDYQTSEIILDDNFSLQELINIKDI